MADEKRLIDANALLGKLSRMIEYCKTDSKVHGLTALFQVSDVVMDCPTVDAVEVVHGYWIERPLDNFRKYEVKCSECGFIGISDYDQYLEHIRYHHP